MIVSENLPLVSIITPVYNGSVFLEELVLSVIAQDYPRIEHIVIDDGSTDNDATVNVLKKYPHLRWWTRENKGQYATINEGFEAAKGELVTTISADDFYASPTVISSVVNTLLLNPDCSGVYGYTLMADECGKALPVQPPKKMPMWCISAYLFIAHCSFFVRSEFLIKNKVSFDKNLVYRGDRDWILHLISLGVKLVDCETYIAVYRFHGAQTTQNANEGKRKKECLLVDQRYSVNQFLKPYIIRYVIMRHRVLTAFWLLQSSGIKHLIYHIVKWRRKMKPVYKQ